MESVDVPVRETTGKLTQTEVDMDGRFDAGFHRCTKVV
jgi:hypothetical protein